MNVTALIVATLISGCGGKPATPPAAARAAVVRPARSAPLAPAPAASLRASVCVFGCSGPEPIDAEGNVYAATFLDVDATTPLAGVALDQFELLDASGVVVAHGTPAAPLTVVSGQSAGVGPFSGNVAAGAHVRLWVSVRLDTRVMDLKLRPPERFRLSLAIQGGSALIAAGPLSPAGATG